jgi:hypothetical protein
MYTRYKASDDLFNAAYTAWISARGVYKGETSRLEAMIADLSANKIRQWDVTIQGTFADDTPDYMILLPNRRIPFQKGSIDQKIYEVRSLGERLTPYAPLAALKTTVDAFYDDLLAARDVQQTKEELVRTKSQALETQRVASANLAYGNIGLLMDKYLNEPVQIERFFDLTLLQSNGGSEPNEPITGTIAGGDTVNILNGGFDDSTQFVIENTGDTALKFCRAIDATRACTDVGIELNPHTSMTVLATDLGPSGNAFLNVTNLDATNQGAWSVIVVG